MKAFLAILLATATVRAALAEIVNFDGATPGALPADWRGAQTGQGEARWTIARDDTAPSRPNVLKQSGEATFPVCVKTDARVQDGFVEVKFKPVAGKEDQAGGVVWRFRDPDNYYVCRANALEGNVVLYKVEQGKRTALDIRGRQGGYGVKQGVPGGQWHTLRVDFAGPEFIVRFNGKQMFEARDGTFPGAGAVGVWTKADSVTLFDDFSYGTR
jgi:hypothetical protein